MHIQKLAKRGALLLVALLAAAELRAQSALDGFDPNVDGAVLVTVVQPDGKILIGGFFSTVSGVPRNHIARLNPDGTLDAAFAPNVLGEPDHPTFVAAIAVQADGKILVGGSFTNIGGQPRNGFARLDPATGLADSFDPTTASETRVYSIVLPGDGKILVGGFFTNIGGQARTSMARLDSATGLADSFAPYVQGTVNTIVVQADGRILIGGLFLHPHSCIARLDPTTGQADSFNPIANGGITSIALQADGKILVGGYFNGMNGNFGGQDRSHLARLDPVTGLADSFNPNPSSPVTSIAVQPDGRILVGGDFTSIGGQARNRIARLDPATGLADSFDPGADGQASSIAVQADGKILVGGDFTTLAPNGGAPVARNHLARLEKDGRLDQTLNPNIVLLPGGNGFVVATVVQPDGKILIGGRFSTVLGVARNNIARLNADGTLDLAFDPNANADVQTIALQADGRILVGGNFAVAFGQQSIGGQPRNRIARLDPTTGAADSFNPDANAIVEVLAVQADGKILAGGSFIGLGGQSRRFIARLDPATGLADSFDAQSNNTVFSIVLQPDGKILVGGSFASIGGQLRNRIARLDPMNGSADSFDPNANNIVYSMAVQPDGKVLAGGQFTSIGGQPRHGFARLEATTGMADSFNPNANSNVYSIALQVDGKILAGGNFTMIGGQTRNHIARFDSATGLLDSFNPNANDQIFSIAIQADGKILAGGAFNGANSIGGQARNFFARLSNDTPAGQDLGATRTTITWTRDGSSPHFSRVSFESSTDGLNYIPLGAGTLAGADWVLTGLNLPIGENIFIRARGYYETGFGNNCGSIAESIRKAFFSRPSVLANISTRLRVQTGGNAMIGGFIITGTQRKTVIVRGIGPSLPIPGALADPIIEVHGSSGQLLAINDNWNDSLTREQIIESGLAPANDLESALWGVIDPGAYTVIVRGNNNGTGIGLFEVYDLDQTANSKLANVSTRGFVETGNNVMIAGAIVQGMTSARVLLRAIGPSLAAFGVPNPLPNPTLELYNGDGALIATNDNWRTDQEAQIMATGLPPSNNLESAIVHDLYPGNYTAIVRGANDTTGVALVEAYQLN